MTLFESRRSADRAYMRTRSSSKHLLTVAAVATMLALPVAAAPQSLADVARKEEQRRKEQPKSGKIYTNATLRSDFTARTPPPEPAPAPEATASDPAAAEPPPPASESKKDEAYWRGRVASAREQLERAESFRAALESQINGLTVDFVNRDDPAQRALVESNRTKAVAEHERVRRDIDAHKKAIAAIEDEARKAGVPPGWLRGPA